MDCFQIDEAYRRKLQRENPAELAFGDYTIGRYAWVMADAILFNKPIPAKGKQGLWNWEGYRMDNENKCCGTCYWHKKCCGEFQCFNESAEGFAIETAYDDGKDCEEWEER